MLKKTAIIVLLQLFYMNICSAQTSLWNVAAGDWHIAGNWTAGVPSENMDAFIQNQGTVTVSEAGQTCSTLSCDNGGIRIVSGNILMTNQMYLGVGSGVGTVVQDGGSNRVVGAQLLLAINPASKGYYYMNGGHLSVSEGRAYGWLSPARYGFGHFVQNGGTVSVHSVRMCIYSGARGIYDLSNGVLRVNTDLLHGMPGQAFFNQSGGLIDIIGSSANMFRISNTDNVQPLQTEYNLTGGELRMTNGAHLRVYNNGVFNFSNSNTTGTVTGNGNLEVGRNRNANLPVGTLRGWGTIGLTGTLENNAEIIADGYGTERALDLSALNAATLNPYDNITNNGWFARNKGELILPAITVAPGNNTYAWGEDAADPVNDLVNSIRMSFTNVPAEGTFTNALLSVDRTDIPSLWPDAQVLSVWKFGSGGLQFDTLTLNFRYDEYQRADTGLDSELLRVWISSGQGWKTINANLDAANKLLTGTLSSLPESGYFAIGNPPPSGLLFMSF